MWAVWFLWDSQKCLDPLPWFYWSCSIILYVLRQTEREGGRERDARRVFLLSCISSCNSTQPTPQWAWSSHMCSPLPPFYISPASPISLPPFLVADLSAAFCPLVASHLEKHCTVISISPAHLPASLPVSLLVRLSACQCSANCHALFMSYSSSAE